MRFSITFKASRFRKYFAKLSTFSQFFIFAFFSISKKINFNWFLIKILFGWRPKWIEKFCKVRESFHLCCKLYQKKIGLLDEGGWLKAGMVEPVNVKLIMRRLTMKNVGWLSKISKNLFEKFHDLQSLFTWKFTRFVSLAFSCHFSYQYQYSRSSNQKSISWTSISTHSSLQSKNNKSFLFTLKLCRLCLWWWSL